MARFRFVALGSLLLACGDSRGPAVAPVEPLQIGSSADAAPPSNPEPQDAGAAASTTTDSGALAESDEGGEGFGVGSFGTLGRGAGPGTGGGSPWGTSDGGASWRSSPSLRQGKTEVTGRLPPEVIQRIVRQNFGRYRLCYENALRAKPDLAGTVRVKLVIERDGSVRDAKDDKSDVKDAGLIACVVKGFANLSFPQPESGIVTVVYPIVFFPPDADPAAPKASSSAAPKPPPKK